MYENPFGLNQLFINSINENNLDNYDFVLYFRIDLFLKDFFSDIFNPKWKTIRYPCICWKHDSVYNGKPRVNDMILYVPKKYFNIINKISICHESWFLLINELNLTDDDLDVMINTYHDSDSQKDLNPLYYIVNRPESTIWHSENEIFTKIIEAFESLNNNKNLIKLYYRLIFILIIVYLIIKIL